MIVQIIISGVLLFVIPVIVGTLFKKVNIGSCKLPFYWVSGQMLLWAGFQLICVPMILLSRRFGEVSTLYNIFIGLMVLLAATVWILEKAKKKVQPVLDREKSAFSKKQVILWIVFAVLLLVQLFAGLLLAYEEGDDAFYVAISTSTEGSDTMYQTLPYSGMTTGLDARHGLAPFPIWITYMAKMIRIPAVCMAQLVVPVMIVLLVYTVFYLLADYLLSDNRENIPFFLILIELLFLFGGYSNYSVENFLLVRATQGKAVIANVILPMLIYLLFVLMKYMKTESKMGTGYWMLLAFSMIAGCLCTTLGCFLTCMLVGLVGICIAVVYGRWKILIPMAGTCIIPVILAFLYFVLR